MSHEPLIHRYTTREAWLAGRRLGIGASEVAAVLGESPYHSAWKVWAEKVAGRSLDDDIEENEAASWGLIFERPIAERFGMKSHRRVQLPPAGTWELFVHPERPWMRATPDAFQWPRPDETDLPDGEPGVLQVKMAGEYKRHEWKDGAVPLHYDIQLQWEMAVTGVSWGSLVVLIGGNRLLGPFDRLRNDDFIGTALPFLHQFWRGVETQTPPEFDGSQATAKAVARLYSEKDGTVATLDENAERAARELAVVREQEAALKQKKNLLKATIIAQMKTASVGLLPGGGRMTYRTVNKRPHFVNPKPYRQLRGP